MIDANVVEELGQFSTPSVLNGLKHLGQPPDALKTVDRLAIRCMSPSLGVRVGYVATMKMESSPTGDASGFERNPVLVKQMNEQVLSLPTPRILAIENVGFPEGPACVWGEVQANLYIALHCLAGITNGPVRDLPEMEAVGFQTFASGLAVGGGFFRMLEVATPIVLGGLTIQSGDLVHCDMHGVLNVPLELAASLPAAIREVEDYEQKAIAKYRSPEFSLDRLRQASTIVKH